MPVLARAIGATPLGACGPGSPANRDLRYVLSDLTRRGQTDGHCFGSYADVLSSFAITGRPKAGGSVELGLPGQAICRSELTSLAINLPDSAALTKLIGRGSLVDMKFSRQTVEIGD